MRKVFLGIICILSIFLVFLILKNYFFRVSQKKPSAVETNFKKSSFKKLKPPLNSEIEKFYKKKIELLTEDKVKIIGDYLKVKDSKFVVLLLHMMPATKESFKEFEEILKENNFSSLAIDLRGHGESKLTLEGKSLDYRYFSDKDHQKSIYDLKAASEFLIKEGFKRKFQYLVGASIGANLALEFASLYPEIKKIVLISCGLNYRGLATLPFLKKLRKDQQILFIASYKDWYAYQSSKKLFSQCQNLKIKCKKIFLKEEGHGTDLFKEKKDLYQEIVNFLKEK